MEEKMKTGLIIFGVIFLVIGILLYLVPMQEIKADTTTIGNGDVDTRTSSARVTVPITWAYATAIIGFVLLMLGLAIPTPQTRSDSLRRDSQRNSSETVVKSKENIKIGDGNKRKIVRERTETHTTSKDEDDEE
jgi:uncharacterized membrane protein